MLPRFRAVLTVALGRAWVVLVLLPLLVAPATAARAHTSLAASSPEEGQSVDEPLDVIRLQFAGAVRSDGVNAVGLFGPDDAEIAASEDVVVSDTVLELPIEALPVAGDYTVRWRITAEDGDRQDGTFEFTYAGPVTPTAAPSPAAAGEPSPTAAAPTPAPAPTSAATPMPAASGPAEESPDGIPASLGLLAVAAAGLVVAAVRIRRRQGGGSGGN